MMAAANWFAPSTKSRKKSAPAPTKAASERGKRCRHPAFDPVASVSNCWSCSQAQIIGASAELPRPRSQLRGSLVPLRDVVREPVQPLHQPGAADGARRLHGPLHTHNGLYCPLDSPTNQPKPGQNSYRLGGS